MTPLADLTPGIDVLPPTGSGKARAVRWYANLRAEGYDVDAAFVIEEQGKGAESYGVTVVPVADETRRVFTVRKADAAVPHCTAVSTEPGWSDCTCEGFTYGKGRRCRHLLALESALDNGWLASADERPAEWDREYTDAELESMAAEYAAEERLAREGVLRVA